MSRPTFFSDFHRRDFLRMGLASALGVSFSGWLPRMALAAQAAGTKPKACILLWMNGGPSQLDTFDPKPGHANGGPFSAIQTAAPGVRISEHLPGLAKRANDLAILRGMSSKEGDHGRATQLMLTGYRPGGAVAYPSLGSSLAKELGRSDADLPGYVSVSSFRFADVGAGFLGPKYAPLTVSGASDDANARANLSVENLAPPGGLQPDAMQGRFGLLEYLEHDFTARHGGPSAAAHQATYAKAVRMVQTQARGAFKLEDEAPELRDRYGRNRFGQGCLLARRLVERGVPFVEVSLAQVPGNDFAWDTHADNFNMVKLLSETLDPAWSSLLDDLRDRGLLDSTLIVWMGEFGRTPTINPTRGRDHFPTAWTTVLSGGGIKGGQAIGDTGKDGMEVVDRPIAVAELYATILAALGIDPDAEHYTPEGRPIRIADNGDGKADAIREVLG